MEAKHAEIIAAVAERLVEKLKKGDIQVAALVFHDGKDIVMCSAGDLDWASGLLAVASHRCAIDAAKKLGQE